MRSLSSGATRAITTPSWSISAPSAASSSGRSSPSSTRPSGAAGPPRAAIARAVAGWSPVTIATLMPARRQAASASRAPWRGGSSSADQAEQRQGRLGIVGGRRGRRSAASGRLAMARTRRPRPASSASAASAAGGAHRAARRRGRPSPAPRRRPPPTCAGAGCRTGTGRLGCDHWSVGEVDPDAGGQGRAAPPPSGRRGPPLAVDLDRPARRAPGRRPGRARAAAGRHRGGSQSPRRSGA